MTEIDFNALGQAIDTTWGRSSTPKVATQSVKFVLLNADTVEVRYVTIINLVDDRDTTALKKRYTEDSSSSVDKAIAAVKETYKEQTEKTIKFKQFDEKDSIEFIDMNIYNGKRTAYFRRSVFFKVS